jgi:hypothetical protein
MAQNQSAGRFALFCRRCSLSDDHYTLRLTLATTTVLVKRKFLHFLVTALLTMPGAEKLLLMHQNISRLLTSVRTRADSWATSEDTAAVVKVSVGRLRGTAVQALQRRASNFSNARHVAL